jgi:hypothetical protein
VLRITLQRQLLLSLLLLRRLLQHGHTALAIAAAYRPAPWLAFACSSNSTRSTVRSIDFRASGKYARTELINLVMKMIGGEQVQQQDADGST